MPDTKPRTPKQLANDERLRNSRKASDVFPAGDAQNLAYPNDGLMGPRTVYPCISSTDLFDSPDGATQYDAVAEQLARKPSIERQAEMKQTYTDFMTTRPATDYPDKFNDEMTAMCKTPEESDFLYNVLGEWGAERQRIYGNQSPAAEFAQVDEPPLIVGTFNGEPMYTKPKSNFERSPYAPDGEKPELVTYRWSIESEVAKGYFFPVEQRAPSIDEAIRLIEGTGKYSVNIMAFIRQVEPHVAPPKEITLAHYTLLAENTELRKREAGVTQREAYFDIRGVPAYGLDAYWDAQKADVTRIADERQDSFDAQAKRLADGLLGLQSALAEVIVATGFAPAPAEVESEPDYARLKAVVYPANVSPSEFPRLASVKAVTESPDGAEGYGIVAPIIEQAAHGSGHGIDQQAKMRALLDTWRSEGKI